MRSKKKKTIVIIGVLSIVFLACFLRVANEPTTVPISVTGVNLESFLRCCYYSQLNKFRYYCIDIKNIN